MKISDIKRCFYEPGKPGIIDAVHPNTGRGVYSGETLEQIQEANPGAVEGDFAAVCDCQADYWRRPPVAITAERFEEMLCVLPPEDWEQGSDWEVFKLTERTSGTVTAIFCRLGEQFFELADCFLTPSDEIVSKCRAVAA